MARFKMTKLERSWVLYDVANSAVVMLSTALIPIYFNTLAAESGLSGEGSPAMVAWAWAATIATLIVALLMPILGSLADYKGNKKKFFIGFFGTGAVLAVMLGIPKFWLAFLVVYVAMTVCLNSSMVFYDSLLTDVTTDERIDQVSANGYAWGYIGSCIPFIACMGIVLMRESLGIGFTTAMAISFVITAAWWVVFTIPLLKNVQQTHWKERVPNPVSSSIKGLVSTLKDIVKNKPLFMYIAAYFFYIDGVHTIISMATSYGASVGIDSTQLVLALLVTQFVAFPSAIFYGKLCGKVGTRNMIKVGVIAYTCITIFAAFFLKSAVEFWILAVAVGLFQGGIQACSRSYYGKLIPKEHSNEYYGFFDVFGKYAAVLGTAIIAIVTQITGRGNLGVLAVGILFIVGLIFLVKMPQTDADVIPGKAAAEE